MSTQSSAAIPRGVWRFGNSRVDEGSRQLWTDGSAIPLTRAAFDLLLCLVEAEGELVTLDELRESLRDGVADPEAEVGAAIEELRDVLGDSQGVLIKSVHGHGYRFDAPVLFDGPSEDAGTRLELVKGGRVPGLEDWMLEQRLETRSSNELWRITNSRGEFGVIKLALDPRAARALRREVTLNKVLLKELGENPPLVALTEWQFQTKPHWIRMPWFEQGSLADWVKAAGGANAIPLERRVRIVAEAAEAFSKAHALGVMHKDIKPGNLLVDASGLEPRLMLCDFGTGTATSRERLARAGVTVMGFTQTISTTPGSASGSSSTTGTPAYMAPEILTGGVFSERSDVFALGVMLFQLVSGEMHSPLAPGWEDDIPDRGLRRIIGQACAGRPEKRTSSMHELARQLRTWQPETIDPGWQSADSRQLSAVVFTDIVGYSAIVHEDEVRGKRLLDKQREVVRRHTKTHHGREVDTVGDGFLLVFGSAVSAVEAVLDIQLELAQHNRITSSSEQVWLRTSVHLDDVEFRGDDVFGDGVNVAARLLPHAEAGGIAVSGVVLESVRKKLKLAARSIGAPKLKNIQRPVEIYLVEPRRPQEETIEGSQSASSGKVTLCVMPFLNAGGDPEKAYFSDGISEDIITDLSKVSALSVVPRNTAFRLKGQEISLKDLARDLGVDHVLEGSVRQAGNRVRINVQLIRPADNAHIWSERYDRDLDDIFALQDEISEAVVSALKLHLLPQEKAEIAARGTRDPEAYRYFAMGRQLARRAASRDFRSMLQLFERAIAIDPQFAEAWAEIGLAHLYNDHTAEGHRKVMSAASRALELDPTLGEAHATMGKVLTQSGRIDEAEDYVLKSLELQPDSPIVRGAAGEYFLARRDFKTALDHYLEAARLDPTDYGCLGMAGQCQYELGNELGVIETARRGLERVERQLKQDPTDISALMYGLVMLAMLNEPDRFNQWATTALDLDPENGLLHYNVACGLVNLKLLDDALSRMEVAGPLMTRGRYEWAKVDSDLDPVREHPRFVALMRMAGDRLESEESSVE